MQINVWTPTIRTPTLTTLAIGVALSFETNSLLLIAIVVSGLLFLNRRKHLGLFLFGAIGGDALLVTVFKVAVQEVRPINSIYAASGYSYPSGHSAAVVVFVGALAYIALRRYRSIYAKGGIGSGFGALVGIVGFDRVYLNVHWFSDVLGGWLFGAFWLFFVVWVFDLLEIAGKFKSVRFNVVANWLYAVSVVFSVLVVALGFIA
jgi:undecaprenyl-diphosphatase